MGISLSQYDEMTPYELRLFAQVFNEKQQIANEEKISLVWLGENLRRAERLPKLEKLLGKKVEPKKPMTDDEMLETVKKLNTQFGGSVEE